MIQCMVAKNSLLNVTLAIHSLHQRLHERFRSSVPYPQPFRCLRMDRCINLCTSMRNLTSPCEVPLNQLSYRRVCSWCPRFSYLPNWFAFSSLSTTWSFHVSKAPSTPYPDCWSPRSGEGQLLRSATIRWHITSAAIVSATVLKSLLLPDREDKTSEHGTVPVRLSAL
jgi:hypothetical protein